MRIELTQETLEIRLAAWERALGLMGNLSLPRSSITRADLRDDGPAAVAHWWPKVGLRLPGILYIARSFDGRQRFIVRRGEPAVELEVGPASTPRVVVFSTPDAERLARELGPGG
jgi:hypothetical protein